MSTVRVCKSLGCMNAATLSDFCADCDRRNNSKEPLSLAQKYPKYHKEIPPDWETLDTYGVNRLFPVDDPSGCILHARKKLLIPGSRTGGKSMREDIKEARDTLSRWLELEDTST